MLLLQTPYTQQQPVQIIKFGFFIVEDNGKVPLTHHQPKDNVGNCVLSSASGFGCRLVVQAATSSTEPIFDLLLSNTDFSNIYVTLVTSTIQSHNYKLFLTDLTHLCIKKEAPNEKKPANHRYAKREPKNSSSSHHA